MEQTQFVLAHEALHCALSHFARRGHRVRRRWDVACDYAINPLLVRDGLRPPPGVLVMDSFEGMTAEEIYPCIDDNTSEEPMDKHVYEGEESGGGGGSPDSPNQENAQGEGRPDRDAPSGKQPDQRKSGGQDGRQAGASQPPPLSTSERERLAARWQQYLASAAQQAQQAGKLSGALARLVDHLLQPQLPWRTLLAHYMSQTARDDYSYLRPSRREGPMILPSLRSAQIDLTVALDVSGSIATEDLGQFLAEIDALKGQLRARVTLVACDSALAEGGPWTFEPWEELDLPRQFPGGGGTSFVPVFEWLAREGRRPDLLLYFTDAEGDFPEAEPNFPVIWLVKGKAPTPWGRRIQLN